MDSENSKTSDPHRLLLNLTDRINLRRIYIIYIYIYIYILHIYVCIYNIYIYILLYQILLFTIHRKIMKNHIRIINLNYELQHGTLNSNSLLDHILYQIVKIILNIYLKSMRKKQLILQ